MDIKKTLKYTLYVILGIAFVIIAGMLENDRVIQLGL